MDAASQRGIRVEGLRTRHDKSRICLLGSHGTIIGSFAGLLLKEVSVDWLCGFVVGFWVMGGLANRFGALSCQEFAMKYVCPRSICLSHAKLMVPTISRSTNGDDDMNAI